MLSTPPAIIRPTSPALIARAAVPIASIPEPQRRLMVAPGTSVGSLASNAAIEKSDSPPLAEILERDPRHAGPAIAVRHDRNAQPHSSGQRRVGKEGGRVD